MNERKIEIAIKAKDEFSGTMEKASKSMSSYADETEAGFDRAGGASSRASDAIRAHEAALKGLALASREYKSAAESLSLKEGNGQDMQETDLSGRHNAELEQREAYLQTRLSLEEAYAEKEMSVDRAAWNARINAASSSSGVLADLSENLNTLTKSRNASLFKSMKAFALADTIIQTYRGAQGAFSSLSNIPIVGPALGTAAAAAAIAAGMARAQSIRSMEPGGSGGSASGGGSISVPSVHTGGASGVPDMPAAEQQTAMQNITVNVHNPLSDGNWDRIGEDIVKSINNASGRNVKLDLRVMEA